MSVLFHVQRVEYWPLLVAIRIFSKCPRLFFIPPITSRFEVNLARCDISPKPNPWDQNRRHFRRITRLAKIILLSRCLGHHCQSQSRPISSQLCKMFFTSCFPIDKLDGNCERKDLNEKHGVMFVNKASRSLIGQFRQGPLCRAI